MPASAEQRDDADVLVIGAGHNGLACACYLASAGLRVRILERRAVVGGAAITEEFHPGFRNSTASYAVSLLHPAVIRELELPRQGLRLVERPLANFLPLPDGRALELGGGASGLQRAVAPFSERDAARVPAYLSMLDDLAAVLREMVLETPPNEGGGWRDLVRAATSANRLRRLPRRRRHDLHELLTRGAGEILDGWFETDALKGALGFDAVVGTFASPYAPGTGYVLLHHVFGEVNGRQGAWGHAIGGMGAITQAMAATARERGVRIDTDAPVRRVLVERGRAVGVELDGGDTLHAATVVANVNPALLFLRLIDADDLDAGFRRRFERWRMGSGTFRMNVALAELPDFRALPGTEQADHHGAGIYIAPSLDYLERAYFEARTDGWASRPVIEMLIPSTVDTTLAPPGRHVASLFCQHFNPTLPGGRSWDDVKSGVVDLILDTVDDYAPNFRRSVLGVRALSPLDLERDFGLLRGDIFHGQLGLDQLWSARPALGHADYRTPVTGLYLCGSGAHPGGGVTGLPGRGCAREVRRDVGRA